MAGTSDHATGDNRVSFLVVDRQSRLVQRPTARVWVARGLKQVPFAKTVARFEPIGVPGGDTSDADGIYVAHISIPTPGKYWYMAEPVGGEKVQALGNLVVRKKSVAPSVGDQAIPSKTPTLASTGGDLAALTTARHPDRALYEVSVAQAIAAHEPFVLAFATPQFCQSRTCGPVVDVVSAVRKQPASKGSGSSTSRSTRTTTPRTASTSGSTSGGSRPSRSRSSSTARVWSAQSSKARSLLQSSSARSPARGSRHSAEEVALARHHELGCAPVAADRDAADDRRRHLPSPFRARAPRRPRSRRRRRSASSAARGRGRPAFPGGRGAARYPPRRARRRSCPDARRGRTSR